MSSNRPEILLISVNHANYKPKFGLRKVRILDQKIMLLKW